MKPKGHAKGRVLRAARPFSVCLALGVVAAGSYAHAQETLLIQPTLPDDFDRGRNVSVTQRTRPDYDPIGIRVGSMVVLPQVNVSLGFSDNLYYSKNDRVSDGFIDVTPSVLARSDWTRHSLTLKGSTTIERYFSQSLRNQTPWDLGALGALEIGSSFRILPELQASRQFETPFSGETAATTAVLSSYFRGYGGIRGEYEAGQSKFTLALDKTIYEFSDIEFSNGAFVNQSDRDRDLTRITGQAQYAFTPSMAVYVQANYTDTVYDNAILLNGDPNRDSHGYRFIAGVNFDLSGLLRGTIGAGYVKRDFKTFYPSIDGFSAEAKIEYFPSELTTVTLQLRRVIEDSAIASNSGFFDTRASLGVDHELLRNLLLRLNGEYARQNYIDLDAKSDIYRITGGAQYLSSNALSFNFNLSYTGRSPSGSTVVGQSFNEFRGLIGVTYKR